MGEVISLEACSIHTAFLCFFRRSLGLHATEVTSVQCSTKLKLIDLCVLQRPLIFFNLYFMETNFNNEIHHFVYQIYVDSDLVFY